MSDSLVRVSRRVEWGARWPTPRAPGCHEGTPARSLRHPPRSQRRRSAGGIIRPAWSPRGLRCRSTPRSRSGRTASPSPAIMTGAHRRPHPLPSRQFQALFDSFFKVLFIFPQGTCSLSVSRRYLAFDGIYRLYLGCIPKQPDFADNASSATGSGHNGLSPSLGAPFHGTCARPSAEDASADYTNGRKAADSHTGLFPFAAATRGILRVFPPDLGSHPSKASGSRRQLPAGVLFRARASTRLRATQGQGGRSHHCRGRRPWGKVFFSQPRQGGKDDHLLAPDDSPDRPLGQAAGHGWGEHAGRDAQVTVFEVGPPRTAKLLSLGTDRPKVVVRGVRPRPSGPLTLSPPGAGSLTPGEGFDGRCDSPPPPPLGIVVQLARLVAPLRESTMILPQVHLRKPLLRLLLPLNDKVQWTSRNAIGRRTANAAADPNTSPTIQSVGATGGVYKGAGTSQREADDSLLTRNSSLKTNNCNDLSPSMMKFSKITRPVAKAIDSLNTSV
ncbi:hypothetical protein H6P81_021413 [Aristolochia fimbriata]|uniref:Uncharacterized protein n=1 Tax=Aristolochia fimbriata TaxID=158543 RepID=A0AAV7DPZ4_ARIFI|nr:hypothetical protein H6P81_021413 [Aristolochia fimbriata]